MFSNLVESGSHVGDLTRKGSFFLGTLGIYAALLLLAGVASIYAYDAHLQTHDQDVILMLPLAQPDAWPAETVRSSPTQQSVDNSHRQPQVVTQAVASIDRPPSTPVQISTAPSVPSVGRGPFIIGNYNAPAIGPSVSTTGGNAGDNEGGRRIVALTERRQSPKRSLRR
ncbi:MAG: hypothetical protein WKF30_03480 [Pyrinomonadaceae bacterium]